MILHHILFAKSAERVDEYKPTVANSLFGDMKAELETASEPEAQVDGEE
jgi:uncharacterized protein YceH (UPF0502 family)